MEVKKKIAFVSANLEMGGIERVVNNLSNKLVEKGYDISIITTKDNKCDYIIDGSIKRFQLPHNENSNHIIRILKKIKYFRDIVKKEEFDVMLSFGSYVTMFAVIASIFTKTKLISSERTDPRSAPENRIVRVLRNCFYYVPDRLVFQTEEARAYFYNGIRKKGIIIPNPINDNLPERFVGERKKEIVNFCRLTKQKNIPLLIDSFNLFHRKHKDYKLIIYGEGKLKDELLSLIDTLHLNNYVVIESFKTNIHELIIDSSMFVSSSDYEGISNSMLEALGIGLPTICTDCPVGGGRMFIKSYENGILVPVNDKQALYNAMCYVVENPEETEKMSEKAIEIKEVINLEKICDKWIECIEGVKN